jgi:hypothetical protein
MNKIALTIIALVLIQAVAVAQKISFNDQPEVSGITTEGFTLTWETNIQGTTEAFWGATEAMDSVPLKITENATAHALSVTGSKPSTLIYILPFSVNGSDTAYAERKALHVTASESSGDIKVYFNASVDHSVALHTEAVFVENAIADTLVNYISRAKQSVDVAIYNLDTITVRKLHQH